MIWLASLEFDDYLDEIALILHRIEFKMSKILMNFVSNRVLLGISNSKICYIKTRKIDQVETLLKEDLNIGYTVLDCSNGIGFLKKPLIMCVIPSDRFHNLKKIIYGIDNKVEFISNDCYTVEGGITNHLLPI